MSAESPPAAGRQRLPGASALCAFTPDPVPTPASGIEDTVQRALVRMREAGIKAVPIVGLCSGRMIKRGIRLGQCYSCRKWSTNGGTFDPRLDFGGLITCLDHDPVHGGSVPPAQGVDQSQGVGGGCTASTPHEGGPR